MRKSLSIMLAILAILAAAKEALAEGDPAVVPSVDLGRYAGRWYEIGRYPTFFQRNCERSVANYTPQKDGTVGVYNVCFRGNEKSGEITGVARVVDPSEPAKLEVDFGFLRRGAYWIIALDRDYRWAVVSGPGKNSLFILARKAPMNQKLLRSILAELERRGFDLSRIVFDKY